MPEVVLIGGANGAGKSTFARYVLPEAMPFLNADEIAKLFSSRFHGNPELESGRLLLERAADLGAAERSFAIESTLASRSLAPRLRDLQAAGYIMHLFFFYLPAPELAIARVASRVRRGGHDIPEEVVRRRWKAGLQNAVELYMPLADTWTLFRNTDESGVQPIAEKSGDNGATVWDEETWQAIHQQTSC